MNDFEHREIGASIRIIGNSDSTDLLTKRMNESFARTAESLNACMFSGVPFPPRRRSWREAMRATLDRVHDAWLVLIGRADIGY